MKQELTFILTPFLATFLFVILGYNILISQTPEARINPIKTESDTEVIEDGNIPVVSPTVGFPSEVSAKISTLPQNQDTLEKIVAEAKQNNQNTILLNIPIVAETGQIFVDQLAQNSSPENVLRWGKRSLAYIHDSQLNAILALSISAKQPVANAKDFTHALSPHIQSWSSLASEYGVSFFHPGIIIAHPMFNQISDEDMTRVLVTVHRDTRKNYTGNIGFSLCCAEESAVIPAGYLFQTIVPTPEFTTVQLENIATQFIEEYKIANTFVHNQPNETLKTYTFSSTPENSTN